MRGVEADGVGVPVGGGIARGKAASDAHVGIAKLLEAFVERTLAKKLVQAIVGGVVAD